MTSIFLIFPQPLHGMVSPYTWRATGCHRDERLLPAPAPRISSTRVSFAAVFLTSAALAAQRDKPLLLQ
jgi:hypothetical protein